jgi:hypothetical protein
MFKILRLDTLEEFASSSNKQELIDLLKVRTWYWAVSMSPKITEEADGRYVVKYWSELRYYDTHTTYTDGGSYSIEPGDFSVDRIVPKHLLEVVEV